MDASPSLLSPRPPLIDARNTSIYQRSYCCLKRATSYWHILTFPPEG